MSMGIVHTKGRDLEVHAHLLEKLNREIKVSDVLTPLKKWRARQVVFFQCCKEAGL